MCHIRPALLSARVSPEIGEKLVNSPLFTSRAEQIYGRMSGVEKIDGRVVSQFLELARGTTLSGYYISLREPVYFPGDQQQIVVKMGRGGAGPFAAEVVQALKQHGITQVEVTLGDRANWNEVHLLLGLLFRDGQAVDIDTLIKALPAPHPEGYTGDRHPATLAAV